MSINFENLYQIKNGLSKKIIYRKSENKNNRILIDFSKDKTEFDNFIKVYNILKKINISIPKIYEINPKIKLIIMEDFGEKSFDKILKQKDTFELLKLAVDNLIIIQNSLLKEDLLYLKEYSFSELKKEISEFIDYYIPYKNIYYFPESKFLNLWQRNFEILKFDFNSFVHKDFEFINLFFLDFNKSNLKCGIIDFQSAFIGFKGWDLFSILENPRTDITSRYNKNLIEYFYENVNIQTDFHTFKKQYYFLNLARHTRLLGRWVKLYKLGQNSFLNYITLTKKRIFLTLNNIHDKELIEIYKKYLSK